MSPNTYPDSQSANHAYNAWNSPSVAHNLSTYLRSMWQKRVYKTLCMRLQLCDPRDLRSKFCGDRSRLYRNRFSKPNTLEWWIRHWNDESSWQDLNIRCTSFCISPIATCQQLLVFLSALQFANFVWNALFWFFYTIFVTISPILMKWSWIFKDVPENTEN